MQWYSPSTNKFLPDRYVEGTCYICGFEGARSDQCDNCGNVLEPEKTDQSPLEDRRCARNCARRSISISTSPKLEPDCQKRFLNERTEHMRDTVIGESLRKIESEGLKARSITRDLDWGIPVPVPGWTEAGKRIYVWFRP